MNRGRSSVFPACRAFNRADETSVVGLMNGQDLRNQRDVAYTGKTNQSIELGYTNNLRVIQPNEHERANTLVYMQNEKLEDGSDIRRSVKAADRKCSAGSRNTQL